VRILIGGDINPSQRDLEYFINGKSNTIFGNTSEIISSSDLIIANLETPLINTKSPINKSGPIHSAPQEAIAGIKQSGINFLNLSNNHILDHGYAGLESTIKTLDRAGINYGGAGMDGEKSSEPKKLKIKNQRIAILSYCEHEFSVSRNNYPGANGLDIIDFLDKIKHLKEHNFYTILLFHGGKEHYMLPTPNQKKTCEFFIRYGADIVVCQHSHISGVINEIDSKHIIYGQGNFVFDPYPKSSEWLYKGLLIELIIKENQLEKIDYHPIIHNSFKDKNNIGINLMQDDEKNVFLNNIKSVSKEFIDDPEMVYKSWEQFSVKHKNLFYSIFNGNGKILRKINQYLPYLNFTYSKESKTILKNIITCETHLEMARTILDKDLDV
jgi:poly-gamma-glutamate capsule biosynthesis protein CapA/YwtB (metallophosphatase superfamily)